MFRTKLFLTCVLLIVLVGAIGMNTAPGGAGLAVAETTSSTSATQLERDRVIGHVVALRSTIVRRDRVEAKLSTWSEFERLRGRDYQVSPFSGALPVWVVAVAGDIRPETSKNGKRYPWGVWVFDARTLEPIFMAADRPGPWPAYFDALPDLAPR